MEKLTILSVSVAAIALFLILICQNSEAQNQSKVRKTIEGKNRNFVRWFNSEQIDSIMTFYRKDACLIAVGCVTTVIRDYYDYQASQFIFRELQTQSVSVADSIAVEKGSWIILVFYMKMTCLNSHASREGGGKL